MTTADVDAERLSMVPPAGLVEVPVGDDAGSRRRRSLLADAVCGLTGTARSEAEAILDEFAGGAASRGTFIVGVLPIAGAVATFIGRFAELAAPPSHAMANPEEFAHAMAVFVGQSNPMCAVETVALPSGPSVRRLDSGTLVSGWERASGVEMSRVQYLLPSRSGRRLVTLNFAITGGGDRGVLSAVAEKAARSVRWVSVGRGDG